MICSSFVCEVEKTIMEAYRANVLLSALLTRSMFTSGLTESNQREVRIVGVDSESMNLVLDYAYTSRVMLSESNIQALFTAASIFQIPALQDQCAQFMLSRLDPQNCIGVYMFADAYGHQELRERSQDYIRKKVSCHFVMINVPKLLTLFACYISEGRG